MHSFVLAMFLVAAGWICAWGQSPVITYLREQEGLNNNASWSENTLHIDSHGFLWIGTQSGLNRYDGDHIRSWNGTGAAPHDLPYNKITAITEDRDGLLWLGTQEEGVIIYNPWLERFDFFDSKSRLPDSLAFAQINKLIVDPQGRIIINTAFQGIFRYDATEDKLQRIDIDVSGQTLRAINNTLLLKDGRLIALAFNGVYVEAQTGGFQHFYIDPAIFLTHALEMPDGTVRIFTRNTNHHYILDRQRRTMTQEENPFSKTICYSTIDSNGNRWTNLEGGLLIREKNGERQEFSLSSEIYDQPVVLCINGTYDDGAGRMYYASAAGAGNWQYGDFPYTIATDKRAQRLKSFNGSMYLATDEDLMKYADGRFNLIPLRKNATGPIFDFMVEPDGTYWVQFDQPIPIFSHFDTAGHHLRSLTSRRMFSQLLQLRDDRITIGNHKSATDDSMAYEFIGSYFEKLSGKAYPDFKAKYYTQLRNGDVWIATFASGLIRLTKQFSQYEEMPFDPNGKGQLNSNNPYYIYESRDGHVFVCTDKGINIWDPSSGRFSYITDDHIELQEVKGMVEGADGVIWILMPGSIWRYDLKGSSTHRFILPVEFKAVQWIPEDLVIDEDGYLFYIGATGIVRVDPAMLEGQPAPNDIVFTDFYVDRKRVFPGDDSRLLDTSIMFQNHIEVHYAHRDVGFSFVSPHGKDLNVTYYYMLEGYRDEWNEAPLDRTIHFTSLSPGQYRFMVKAVSGNGKWTLNTSAIAFHISPPWYQRWWAYVLYAIALSSVAYGFYRYRVNELLKYQTLRTKISSDLHDDVGTILGSIAMEAEILAYNSDAVKAPLLQRLSQLSREAMGRMRDTVWAIDSRKDNLEFLTDRMKDYLAETLSRTGFAYTWTDTSDMNNKVLPPDIRQNVFLIFKEAINNVLKHSKGTKVDVSLSKEKSRCVLRIRDNGQVHQPINTSGLGLANMRLRAENIGANISVQMEDGFEVVLKFDIA